MGRDLSTLFLCWLLLALCPLQWPVSISSMGTVERCIQNYELPGVVRDFVQKFGVTLLA